MILAGIHNLLPVLSKWALTKSNAVSSSPNQQRSLWSKQSRRRKAWNRQQDALQWRRKPRSLRAAQTYQTRQRHTGSKRRPCMLQAKRGRLILQDSSSLRVSSRTTRQGRVSMAQSQVKKRRLLNHHWAIATIRLSSSTRSRRQISTLMTIYRTIESHRQSVEIV